MFQRAITQKAPSLFRLTTDPIKESMAVPLTRLASTYSVSSSFSLGKLLKQTLPSVHSLALLVRMSASIRLPKGILKKGPECRYSLDSPFDAIQKPKSKKRITFDSSVRFSSSKKEELKRSIIYLNPNIHQFVERCLKK